MSPSTRAIRIHETGGPEVLRAERTEISPPGPGDVRLRQTFVGVNFIDTYHRSGFYPLPSLPHGLGMEAAGVVEEVGEDIGEFEPGDRVAYAAGPPGAYAAERVLPAQRLVPLPEGISDETAAASLLRGMTVEYLVRRCFRVEEGMQVLWHAAAGGVGLIACGWLADLGAEVIGTVGSAAKAELAREHGCVHAIRYREESFVERVREITGGEGVPVVYDSVGKDTFAGSLECLARRGTLVAFGNASGSPEPFDPLELSRRGSLYLTRPTLMDYTAERGELLDSAAALFDRIGRGAVRVSVGQEWPLEEAAEAHRALEARATTGSTVLRV